jgi:hypothetical protein
MPDADALTLEWSGLRERRRIDLEPGPGGTWLKIHKAYRDGRWVEIGKEPAEDVVVQTADETLIADA